MTLIRRALVAVGVDVGDVALLRLGDLGGLLGGGGEIDVVALVVRHWISTSV